MASSALSRGKSGKDEKRSARPAVAEKARSQPWRAEEVAALRSLARKKLTPAQIARELNRTHGKGRTRESIEVYCARHDIRLPGAGKTAAPRASAPAKDTRQPKSAPAVRRAAAPKAESAAPARKRLAGSPAATKPAKTQGRSKPAAETRKPAAKSKPSVVERVASVVERVASVIERATKVDRSAGTRRPAPKTSARRAPVPAVPIEAPARGPVALADLRLQDCRWPLGGLYERTTLFCGKQHQPGSPYCPEHHARSLGRSAGASEGPSRFAKTG